MEQSKTRNHRARHKTRASLLSDKGLDAANHNRASGGGRRMFLTSLLIEQAFTVRREKALVHSGVKDPPGNWIAPPGNNRSGGGGNKAARAFGVEGRIKRL